MQTQDDLQPINQFCGIGTVMSLHKDHDYVEPSFLRRCPSQRLVGLPHTGAIPE